MIHLHKSTFIFDILKGACYAMDDLKDKHKFRHKYSDFLFCHSRQH
jgi:hypothetical protein